jgi:hypothetical protein
VKSVQRRIRADVITIVFMSAFLGAFAYHFNFGWPTFLIMVTVYIVVRGLLTFWWIGHPKPPQPATRYTR